MSFLNLWGITSIFCALCAVPICISREDFRSVVLRILQGLFFGIAFSFFFSGAFSFFIFWLDLYVMRLIYILTFPLLTVIIKTLKERKNH